MPNNVNNSLWLVRPVGGSFAPLTDDEVKDFWSPFIKGEKFDFNTLIPMPDNIWLGSVGGTSRDHDDTNIKEIRSALSELVDSQECPDSVIALVAAQKLRNGEDIVPEGKPSICSVCLSDAQIINFGMVNGLDWCSKNWDSKWGAYDCSFDFSGRWGNCPQVSFYTAWSPAEKICRVLREKANAIGLDIIAEFDGELDNPGDYIEGLFSWYDQTYNEETDEYTMGDEPIETYR